MNRQGRRDRDASLNSACLLVCSAENKATYGWLLCCYGAGLRFLLHCGAKIMNSPVKIWPDFCCSGASRQFFAVFAKLCCMSHEIFLARHVLL